MNEQELLRRLREAFQEESTERLTTITTKLVELENSNDLNRQAILEDIYREAHSLKGAARAVNLLDIENVCQAIETVFGSLKSENLKVETALFDVLHRAVTGIGSLMTHDDQETVHEVELVVSQLLALHAGEKIETKPPSPSFQVSPLKDETTDSLTSTVGQPDTSIAQPEEQENEPQPNVDTPEDQQENSLQGELISEAKVQTKPEARLEKGVKSTTVRIGTEKLDFLLRKTEEMIALKLVSAEQLTAAQQLKSGWEKIQVLLNKDDIGQESIERFRAMNQENFGNLKQAFENLLKAADQNKRTVATMVDDLLDDMKNITMLPLTTLTDMLPRMVRDIARQQDKEIELKMKGTDIEIDRRILEELKDPLVHLVRNGIDHGIESKKERLVKNKNEKARLSLDIHQREGGKIELIFLDNGRGMDPENLKNIAVKKGIISKLDAEELDEQQCFELIFQSGMTTSSIITEISGRGLGMAIVQEKIEQLGGSIKLDSTKDLGTKFEIQLPVSLATFRGVLIVISDREFMISSNLVDTVVRISTDQVKTIENKSTIPFEAKSLPIVDLGNILNLKSSGTGFGDKELKIVVLGTGEKRIGFRVDEVIGEQEILVKNLGKQLIRVKHITGATILGSGKIVPVLNVRDLMATASQTGRSLNLKQRKSAEGDTKTEKSILIAEDSITSRMLLRSILEGAGYKVTAAVDGLDALTRLKSNPVDLVVSDVQMPRMSGFELSSQIRQDQRLKDIPLILCTSLASTEDKERGVEVGASAYIVKSNFDQSNLLQVVERLI